jgi:hypothetical protein
MRWRDIVPFNNDIVEFKTLILACRTMAFRVGVGNFLVLKTGELEEQSTVKKEFLSMLESA